ncbi:Oligouridylate-binding protein 1B [Dionaea muscipula]
MLTHPRFINYFDRKAARMATMSVSGKHLFEQPITICWANASLQLETSSHFNIFAGARALMLVVNIKMLR